MVIPLKCCFLGPSVSYQENNSTVLIVQLLHNSNNTDVISVQANHVIDHYSKIIELKSYSLSFLFYFTFKIQMQSDLLCTSQKTGLLVVF